MKIIKGIFFPVVLALAGSCFDPPEYPNVPQIEYEGIEFFDGKGQDVDSLVLSISFVDGDGDLGLPAKGLDFISDPYNNKTFYLTNNGTLVPVQTQALGEPVHQLLIPDPTFGKLVTVRTRQQPAYSSLPEFNCTNYTDAQTPERFLISAADAAVLDPSIQVVDTLFGDGETFYEVRDSLYYTVNPNHYNIEVDFLVRQPGPGADENGFIEYDWRQQFCMSFDGRFPVLADHSGPLEGTLRYGMVSLGILNIFSIKVMKLRVQIKDRALNKSNVMETPEFTLDRIRRN